jgi:transaldolase
MEIFIDTAKIDEIRRWLDYGVIDGVTTNPSIMLKDGVVDVEAEVKKIAALIGKRPLSVEVTTNDLKEMLTQAQTFAGWSSNIVVKIPVINADGVPCLGVIQTLEKKGIRVNATAAMSFGQVVLTSKAGATYTSIFAGRVADEGSDPAEVIAKSVEWLTHWDSRTKIIVGSIRGVIDVQTSALAGAHVITIPPQLLLKMMDHKYTRSTVHDFVEDAKKAAAPKSGGRKS